MEKPKLIIIQKNNSIVSTEGEPIELQVERLVSNGEPTEGEAPLVYQERAEGVAAQYNIRTDRFEIAIEAMEKVAKSYEARREERAEALRAEEEKGDPSQSTVKKD